MIIYGFSMQEKSGEKIPKEIAGWLFERSALYPNIDFKIDCVEYPLADIEKDQALAHKYSRTYGGDGFGITIVGFPYHKEIWQIRIIGGCDGGGNIIDMSDAEAMKELQSLDPALRATISGCPPLEEMDEIITKDGWFVYGVPRRADESVAMEPDMVPFPPDFRWTSEPHLTPKDLTLLVEQCSTTEELARALEAKKKKLN